MPNKKKKKRTKIPQRPTPKSAASLPRLNVAQQLASRLNQAIRPVSSRSQANVFGDAELHVGLLDPYKAAEDYMQAFIDPTHAGDVYLPDRYTQFPTACYHYKYGLNPTIYKGTTANDGALLFVVRNDSYHTYDWAALNADLTIGAWTCVDTDGAMTSSYRSRPVVVGATFQFIPVGNTHSIRYSMTRCGGAAYASQVASDFIPTVVSNGVTTTQVVRYFGHDGILTPEKNTLKFSLTTLSDASATKFLDPTADRTLDAGEAVCVWVYGLSSADTVRVTTEARYQYYPLPGADWFSYSNIAIIGPNSTSTDITTAVVSNVKKAGDDVRTGSADALAKSDEQMAAATQSTLETAKKDDFVDNVVDGFKKVAGLVTDWLPFFAAAKLSRNLPLDHTMQQLLQPQSSSRSSSSSFANMEEKKVSECPTQKANSIDDLPVVITPRQARRPSLTGQVTGRLR